MGVTKTILQEGSGPSPKVNDTVTIEYTGYLKDTSKPGNKGDKYVAFLYAIELIALPVPFELLLFLCVLHNR